MSLHIPTGQTRRLRMHAESGQAIVVMALMMIALLGILGLAIDGGGLYFMWRDVRNASDAAVLAAAYAKCTDGDIVTAGLNAARTNGFDNNGTSNTVQVVTPPTVGEAIGDADFVQVTISANRPSYFIHLVYKGPLAVTNTSVAYCREAFDPSKVPGLWAGDTDCNNTVNWQGSDVRIEGGMYSNDEVYVSSPTSNLAVVTDTVEYRNSVGDMDKVIWDPGQPTRVTDVRPDPMNLNIGLFDQDGEVATNIVARGGYYTYIGPGYLGNDYQRQGGVMTWSPNNLTLRGLYYVVGDVKLGTVGGANQNQWDQTVGATVVATGAIDLGGHNGHFARYYEGMMWPTDDGVTYPGILFYSAFNNPCGESSNTKAISMTGNEFRTLGVIYAPHGNTLFGGSDLVMNGSVIADAINYQGSKGWLLYDPSLLPPRPPSINMAQ